MYATENIVWSVVNVNNFKMISHSKTDISRSLTCLNMKKLTHFA